jgi:hypothetical protein
MLKAGKLDEKPVVGHGDFMDLMGFNGYATSKK